MSDREDEARLGHLGLGRGERGLRLNGALKKGYLSDKVAA